MFDFSKTELNEHVTTDEILQKVGEYSIFKRYCSNFQEINKSFLSDLYHDTNPSCRIYVNGSNKLVYKDFGTGDMFDCFSYVQKKYNCNFTEALNIIANDFNIRSIEVDLSPSLILSNDDIVDYKAYKTNKATIDIISQSYTMIDYDVWNQYEIPLDIFQKEEIYSCSHVFIKKGDNVTTLKYTGREPLYAYKEYDIDLNFLGYRIYSPNANRMFKWLNSSSNRAIQGIKSIPDNGDLLIITKSRKDVLIYKLMGYNAIALPSESTWLHDDDFNRLLKRFKRVILNLDNDETGRYYTDKIVSKTGLKCFYIDIYKDISDYVKNKGLEDAKIMINNKLDG
jgi:hypothetical protein